MYHQTDLGNAELFRDIYKDKLIFDTTYSKDKANGRWLIWDKYWWKPAPEHVVYQHAADSVRARERYALAAGLQGKELNSEIRFSLKSESFHSITALINSAKNLPGIIDELGEWDENPQLIGVKDGVIDLKLGNYIKPDQKQRITRHVDLVPDFAQPATLWEKTIGDIFNSDDELIYYIQRAVGYSVTGNMSEQCLFCLCGQGSNGKSTFLDTIIATLGPYTYTMPFSTIDKMTKSNISNDVASIMNHRFVISSESDEDAILNSARIKGLTGDRNATARKLYENNKTFQPQAKYWLAFNQAPQVVDCSYGFWRRIRKIDLKQQFPQGGNLFDRLMEERPQILAWIVAGAKSWFGSGKLPVVQCIQQSTDDYRNENDRLCIFVSECLETDELLTCDNTELYNAYNYFCTNTLHEKPLKHREFTQQMLGKGFKQERNSSHRFWSGFGIKNSRFPSMRNPVSY